MKTEKHRQSKAKGQDVQAQRTAEGVAVNQLVPTEVFDPGWSLDGNGNYFKFKAAQLDFLKEYAKDLDEARAAKELGLKLGTIRGWLDTPAIRAEIDEIHKIWKYNIRMTAEHSAGRHLQLMDKFENDYDSTESAETRAKMMNPLVKASETYLRAAGHFNHGGVSHDTNVTINISLGDDGIVIDG